MFEWLGFELVFRQGLTLWGVPLGIVVIPPAILLIGALFMWHFIAARKALKESAWLRMHKNAVEPRRMRYARRFAACSMIVAPLLAVWAEPEWRTETREPLYGRVCLAFIWDVSLSMKYAHDVAPYPDRLAASKAVIQEFGEMTEKDPKLRGAYCRAVIPFAGSALAAMQFSTSTDEFRDTVMEVDETTANVRGTNLYDAFRVYKELAEEYAKQNDNGVFIAVLLTDGGKGEGNQHDIPRIQRLLAGLPNTVVYTVGFGKVEVITTADGTTVRKSIPVKLEKRDGKGAFLGYVLANEYEEKSPPLSSELDERILEEIARATGGRYIHYVDKGALLAELKKAILTHRVTAGYTPRLMSDSAAGWFLAPAFALMFFTLGYAGRLMNMVATLLRVFRRRTQVSPSS